MEPVQLAAILAGAVLVASMISVEAGISVALIELALGVLLGNVFSLDPNATWLSFIAGFASVVLTFLAGAEVDPDDFRERFWPAVAIGVVSFVGPFVFATLVAIGPLGWTMKASLIAGTALSTTSLAVVYAVLVETGLNTVRVGKLIMSACFVTDMCTVIALSTIFIQPTIVVPGLPRRVGRGLLLLPKFAPWFFRRYGDRVIEPEIKLVFVVLFGVDGARRRGQEPGGATGIRARPGDVAALPATQGGATTLTSGCVCVSDPVLLPARRAERLPRCRVCRTSACSAVLIAAEDGAQARTLIFPLAHRHARRSTPPSPRC